MLKKINEDELYKRIIELKTYDYHRGIKPYQEFRNMPYSMLEIFKMEKIDIPKLMQLYDIYDKQIVVEYLNDLELKNKTILTKMRNTLIEDHTKNYSETKLHKIIGKFLANQELNEKEKYVLVGILQKYAELIHTYNYNNLIKYKEYIQKEINLGIFKNIVVNGKEYKASERRKLVKLSSIWNRDTLDKYNNLELLKKRLQLLPENNEILKYIQIIDKIQQMNLNKLQKYSTLIQDYLQEMYFYYEINNRQNIINKVYNPDNKKEMVIDNLNNIKEEFLLHFFGPYNKLFDFSFYINKLEEMNNKEYTAEEKASIRKKFEVMNNNYIVNKTVSLNLIGQTNETYKYLVDIQNQLSCTLVSIKDIYEMKGIRGNLALGFSKKYLEPDQIATISNKNIHSNKSIDNVETTNDFKDFSATYKELLNKDIEEYNTEIVMFRNTDLTTLKPSYLLYISYADINSEHEKKNIEIYKEQMREAGLDIPFIIFDNHTIKKNLEREKEEER